jgi:hypothetical protein
VPVNETDDTRALAEFISNHFCGIKTAGFTFHFVQFVFRKSAVDSINKSLEEEKLWSSSIIFQCV